MQTSTDLGLVPPGYEPIPDFAPTRRQIERVLRCSLREVDALVDRGVIEPDPSGPDRVRLASLIRYCGRTGLIDPEHVRAALAVPRDMSTFPTSRLAELLGFSPDVVRRMIDRADIEAYRLPGGARLVARDSLIRFLAINPGRQAPAMGLRSTGGEPVARAAKGAKR